MDFLSREQVRNLATLAEQARQALGRFVGHKVTYDDEIVRLLDEWIDDALAGSPVPNERMRLVWTSLLGELFRRRHEGWWALQDGELTIVCPTHLGERRPVPVQEQVERRIALGMSESLTYFYNISRIALKLA